MNPVNVTGESIAETASRFGGRRAPIRVFAACGDTMYRLGLQAALADDGGFAWTGEAAHFEALCERAPALMPDVVLMDAQLPGLPSLSGLPVLRAAMPRTRFALMLAQLSPEPVRAAIAGGAAGMLAKSADQDEIISAIKAVHGGSWACPESVMRTLTAPQGAAQPPVNLTPRERDLLALMAQGLSNAEIAGRLCIALPTVKFHVGHIMTKLGAENRTAAVLIALRRQLVDLHDSSVGGSAV